MHASKDSMWRRIWKILQNFLQLNWTLPFGMSVCLPACLRLSQISTLNWSSYYPALIHENSETDSLLLRFRELEAPSSISVCPSMNQSPLHCVCMHASWRFISSSLSLALHCMHRWWQPNLRESQSVCMQPSQQWGPAPQHKAKMPAVSFLFFSDNLEAEKEDTFSQFTYPVRLIIFDL